MLLPKPQKRPRKIRRRLPRAKKTPLAKLKKEADRLWREAVLKRDGYKCRNCEQPQESLANNGLSLQGAHGFRRRTYGRVRWDLENGFALCERCHVFFTWRETEWGLWMVTQLGRETLDLLLAKSRAPFKINRLFLEQKIEELKNVVSVR
jgi:hypothetical protein